ncbi:MAG: nucleotide exchange factor GrpE [Sedimentibacter saalensis]|uniref:nucleotide exchange factor GrpE n=1 Tax=Sedimentibacter saalensis TaxID=130788 RepID=UPI002B20D970|nr:nucleotide exchange factor GrpE [Sedimentibacter saalensis]MEA5095481.1 nucleotide exchange factor GrpE [Sedimentibacter saalensis]
MAKAKKHDEEKVKEKQQDNETSNAANEESVSKENEENKNNKETEIEDKKESNNEEVEILNNRLLRLQADFLNYKSRTEKEKLSSYGNAVSDMILELLPVVDNLERALATENSENNTFKEGVQMVYTQLMGILDKKGLKEVESLHKQFDHNVHYGVAFEASDEFEDGIILDVLQKGYTVNDKLVRPAMVRICRK